MIRNKYTVKVSLSCLTFCNCSPWNSPGQNTGVDSLSLLQGIFPTQGLNPGLPLCRWILYQLSHQGSPRVLEWVAYPFSRGTSWSRNWTGVSCIAVGPLPAEPAGKPTFSSLAASKDFYLFLWYSAIWIWSAYLYVFFFLDFNSALFAPSFFALFFDVSLV